VQGPTVLHAAVLAGAVLAGATAEAEPKVGSGLPFALTPSETATLAAPDDVHFRVVAVGPTRIAPEGPPAPKSERQEHTYAIPNAAFSAAEGTVVFSFWSDDADGGRLKLENGLSRAMIYSAVITRTVRGKPVSQATSICSVRAGKIGYETWPYPIAKVEITGFYSVPLGEDVCGNPERGEIGPPPQ
jgi:hypothetical protein